MSDPVPHSVVVFGSGAVTVVPDVAQIEVSLEVVAPDPATAYTQGNDVAHRVVAALDAHGVAETDRQTRSVGLMPHYAPGTPTVDGCAATHTLLVRIAALAAVSDVLDALVAAGGEALRVNGFTLTGSDTADAYARAEVAAVADARERAQRLAEAAGVTLGEVVAVRQEPARDGGYARGLGFAASGRQSGGVPVQAGGEVVTAQVTVTFALDDVGPGGRG